MITSKNATKVGKGQLHVSLSEHEKIVKQILILLGREASHLGRWFHNPTGVAFRDYTWGRQYIQYGVVGSPDIYGIILGGHYVGIEVKSGAAKQQKNQIAFEKMIKSFGGHYVVARSAEEALDSVLRVAVSCN